MKKCEKLIYNNILTIINFNHKLTFYSILFFFGTFINFEVLSQQSIDSLNLSLKKSVNTINISAVGDIMFGTNFPSKKYLPKNEDCIPLIENIKNYFNESDIIFGT